MKNLQFSFDYELKGVVGSVIKEFKAEIIDQNFSNLIKKSIVF